MDPESGKLIKRLEVGQSGANISFCPDGRFGYVAVTGENTVAVLEMESLEVEKKVQTGEEPVSLIVL
jgi:YVTN family beta-propeller protein